jgi:hypothetical protein
MSNKKGCIVFSRGTSPEAVAEDRSFCEEVDRLCEENERELEDAAGRSGCTVEELEDSHWEAERQARQKMDAFFRKKGLPLVDWTSGASAWLMVGNLPKEDQ